MTLRIADCLNKKMPESTIVWQLCAISPNCEIEENYDICAGSVITKNIPAWYGYYSIKERRAA